MQTLIFVLGILITSMATASTPDAASAEIRRSAVHLGWSIDSLNFAITNKLSAQACLALGEINFARQEMQDRTVEGADLGVSVTDKTLIALIEQLPAPSVLCGGKNTIEESSFVELQGFAQKMKATVQSLLSYLAN